jgi:murein L,D-transpeptidase YcbB/YkuD
MKKPFLFIVVWVFLFLLTPASCQSNNDKKETLRSGVLPDDPDPLVAFPFDSTLVIPFFAKNPELKKYQSDVRTLYRKHQYHYIWHDQKHITQLGLLLYDKLQNLSEEGVEAAFPYKDKLDQFFQHPNLLLALTEDAELLIASAYFFYMDNVYYGLDSKAITQTGWYLPRKKPSYVNYLDTLLKKPLLIHKDESAVFVQYYRLRELLKKYRQMDQKGTWLPITLDSKVKAYHPGDSAATIAQIRRHLFLTEDLTKDSQKEVYDAELAAGILNYKKRNGYALDSIILPKHIASMNIPLAQRIKTILVNMERCRWMSGSIRRTNEFIVINIPAYQLTYFIDGKKQLVSEVVVGKAMNKTVVFSADMKYIVFSPYWNVPNSILHKEILPEIAKNKNYLAQHNMEWHEQGVRQRPGTKNALGLVKFLFPNNNSIYLHDTPSKYLFKQEQRAFSHGCIRVAKPVELARLILRNDPNWTSEKIDRAMNRGIETWHPLKNKIPVYIGYFTTWVDSEGFSHFYNDVYQRDEPLASLLFKKEKQ